MILGIPAAMEGDRIPFVECIDRYCVKELPNTRFGEKGELMKKVKLILRLFFITFILGHKAKVNLHFQMKGCYNGLIKINYLWILYLQISKFTN